MFWRVAGLAATSPVDIILDKDQYTLQELLDEDDLIQECKSLNNRLVNFLKGKAQVEQMIRYVVEAPGEDADDKRTFKFPFISCEVFTCDIDQILSTVIEEEEIMDLLFSFAQPDRPHSNLLAGYFSKVAISLLIRKTPEVMAYLQSHQEVLDNLIRLIGITSVLEVVMKLVGADDQIMMYHSDKLPWLADTTLLDTLLDQLSAQSSSDVQANAAECLSAIARTSPSALASQLSTPRYIGRLFQHVLESPHAMSSVINSLTVCITLLDPKRALPPGMMRNQQQMFQMQHQQQQQQQQVLTGETVEGMVQRLGELIGLLTMANDDKVLPTTYGQLIPPLGIHRLKIVEFIGVLLGTNNERVREELVKLGGVKTCLDLLFRFHFNNFLHHHVERMVLAILESGSSLLLDHLFGECDLLNRIMAVYDNPSAPDTRPEPRAETNRVPARSGYMGHLTRLANKICQLAGSNSHIEGYIQANPRWVDWQRTALRKRNLLENVYQWSCGRPAALDDRPGDSDDDEFGSRDRDFDISSISLTGGAGSAYGNRYGSLLHSDDMEEGQELRDPYDVDLVKAEQEIENLSITESGEAAARESEPLSTPASEEPESPLSGEKADYANVEDGGEAAGAGEGGADEQAAGFKPLLLDGPTSLFTCSESAQTAWVAFQEEQQQISTEGGEGDTAAESFSETLMTAVPLDDEESTRNDSSSSSSSGNDESAHAAAGGDFSVAGSVAAVAADTPVAESVSPEADAPEESPATAAVASPAVDVTAAAAEAGAAETDASAGGINAVSATDVMATDAIATDVTATDATATGATATDAAATEATDVSAASSAEAAASAAVDQIHSAAAGDAKAEEGGGEGAAAASPAPEDGEAAAVEVAVGAKEVAAAAEEVKGDSGGVKSDSEVQGSRAVEVPQAPPPAAAAAAAEVSHAS